MTELGDYFRSQAEWRERKAAEYPDDHRNEQSAAALHSLAEYVEDEEVASPTLDLLNCHCFEGVSLGGEETQREVSRYGFGYYVSEAQHADFLEELAILCMVDAYKGASEGGASPGEDWTETLLPFELEAAKDGVHLPHRYFQRRSHSTEYELETVVAEYREA